MDGSDRLEKVKQKHYRADDSDVRPDHCDICWLITEVETLRARLALLDGGASGGPEGRRDLGWADRWIGLPEEYTACIAAGHLRSSENITVAVIGMGLVSHMLYWCDECKIQWHINLMDAD